LNDAPAASYFFPIRRGGRALCWGGEGGREGGKEEIKY